MVSFKFNTLPSFSSEVRCFGVTLDHKLCWKNHINKKVNERSLLHFRWNMGLKTHHSKLDLHCNFNPLTYTSVVCWTSLQRQINTKVYARLNVRPPSLCTENCNSMIFGYAAKIADLASTTLEPNGFGKMTYQAVWTRRMSFGTQMDPKNHTGRERHFGWF